MENALTEISTPRLRIRLQTPDEARESIANMPPEMAAEVSPTWLAKMQAAEHSDPWLHGFAIGLLSEPDREIGRLGFKGPPEGGVVEVAYGIDDAYQGNGYASEALRGIASFALAQSAVAVLRAHTLAENSPSTSVLKKNGFVFSGEVTDPEDGQVWRWELKDLPVSFQ